MDIIESIEFYGIDYKRLKGALDSNEKWGSMVHAFEYLTVLGVVETAMRLKEEESKCSDYSD